MVLVDIDADALSDALYKLSGPGFVAKTCDVTDPQDLARLAAEVAEFGEVATLVNNAGAARAVSLHDTTAEIWRKDNALNLEAPFLCFRAFEEALKRTQGSVINITSVNGMAVFGHPAYSAAKAGLIHLTKLIAVEYGKFGIRANAVAPGTVRTQAWEARAATNPQVFEEAKHWYPLQRIVRPGCGQCGCFSRWPAGCRHQRRVPAGRLWADGRPSATRPDIFAIRTLLTETL